MRSFGSVGELFGEQADPAFKDHDGWVLAQLNFRDSETGELLGRSVGLEQPVPHHQEPSKVAAVFSDAPGMMDPMVGGCVENELDGRGESALK